MEQKRKKRKKKTAARAVIALIAVCAAIAAGFLIYLDLASEPVDPAAEATMPIEIPSGSSTGAIARLLSDNGLIKSSDAFKLKSRLDGFDGRYKAGYYELSAAMTMEEIMARLMEGSDRTVRFTIPEGFDIMRTSERLHEAGLIDKETFVKLTAEGDFDYRFLEGIPRGENRLEGFLYPDTYEVYANATEEEILTKMLDRFDGLFEDAYYDKASEMGLTVSQLITMASIVEREAKVAADRPMIASVFYNRLKIGMPLQSCATVQYILGEQKERLTNQDIAIDDPYNTYKNQGLPPGPICSPGIASIEAALEPADTKYLYFLAKGDGSHVFSETYEEFLENKARYID